VIGGGPAGLGAAWRLHESGHADWQLLEKDDHVGGLASSHVDENGFTWDLGGHVVFSHCACFDRLLDSLLANEWVQHVREAWIWMRDRFIPYPLQNNIRHLPTPELLECLDGLLEVRPGAASGANGGSAGSNRPPAAATFADWIRQSFGAGLARVFLNPYNTKVWATDPAEMTASWVGERVATVDLNRILHNVIEGRDDVGWGPNATFRFPLHGGTGRIWQAIAERLPAERVHLGTEVVAVDSGNKVVHLSDGTTARYDALITTMPVDLLLGRISDFAFAPRHTSALPNPEPGAGGLRYSSTHIVGIGLAGAVPERLATKCWMYFPEPELPFYRVTVFSNYSPHNVPHPGRQWSLMAEVSESARKPVDGSRVVQQVIDGLKAARLMEPGAEIESVWHCRVEHGYPTPSLDRDALLGQIEPALRARHIFSRGRFGAWKYEVGNMDHSFMQGVEAVNHILYGEPETTLPFPGVVNAPSPSPERNR
jgi:protoporphyrinogen oxidase